MVGLKINVDEEGDPVIEMEEFEEIYFKLKIYACDDLDSLFQTTTTTKITKVDYHKWT